MTIGEKIKLKRNEKNWSQRELAKKMGYSHHSTLARIEAGKVDVSNKKILKFAEVLDTTVEYLMDREHIEEMQKNNSIITNAVMRMRQDANFLSMVETLNNLTDEQLKSVMNLLSAFSKAEK